MCAFFGVCRYNLAVLGTNHMVSGGGGDLWGNKEQAGERGGGGGWGAAGSNRGEGGGIGSCAKPALGEHWRSQPSVQVQLAHHRGSIKSATLTSSPNSVSDGMRVQGRVLLQ